MQTMIECVQEIRIIQVSEGYLLEIVKPNPQNPIEEVKTICLRKNVVDILDAAKFALRKDNPRAKQELAGEVG